MKNTKVKKEPKLLPLRKLHVKTWNMFSKYIRSKNANWAGLTTCYTCGIWKPWKELQAGHLHHGKLDFDERNIHPQCVKCNQWLHGNLALYAVKLVDELGLEEVQQLKIDAYRKGNAYTRGELDAVLADLKAKPEHVLEAIG